MADPGGRVPIVRSSGARLVRRRRRAAYSQGEPQEATEDGNLLREDGEGSILGRTQC